MDRKKKTLVVCGIDQCESEMHKNSLWKHRKIYHPKEHRLIQAPVPGFCKCAQGSCTFSCRKIADLRTHLRQVHGIPMETEEHYFPNIEAFSLWKDDYEILTTCRFVKSRGSRGNQNGCQYYMCNKSAHNRKSRSTGKRRCCSKKTNIRCTAGINTTHHGTTVHVKNFKTHYGHSLDSQTGEWRVTASEYREIAVRLDRGEKLQQIIGDLNQAAKMPRKKAQARRHEVIDTRQEEEEEEVIDTHQEEEEEVIDTRQEEEEEDEDVIEQEQVKAEEQEVHVMDLTEESSDDEIQEVTEISSEVRSMKRPADGSTGQQSSKVVRLDRAPTAINPKHTGLLANSSNQNSAAVARPSQPQSYNLATQVAYLEAQRAERRRQESIKNFVSSSTMQNPGYTGASNAAPPHMFDLLRRANPGNVGYYNQMKAVGPRPVQQTVDLTKERGSGLNSNGKKNPQTVDLTKESSSGAANSYKKNNSSSNGTSSKLVEEFETGYKCMRCLELFPSRADLKYHIIKVHSDLLSFKCGKCGQVFSKQAKLEKHERNHGRDKLYVCVKCDSSFYQLENLKRHEKTHEEKKSYKCTGCTRVFTEMEKLVNHERIHKKNELPFQCEVENCGEGFHARGNLKMHIRLVHTKKGKKK